MDGADFENAVKIAKALGVDVHEPQNPLLNAPTPKSIDNGARFVVNGLFFKVVEKLSDRYEA